MLGGVVVFLGAGAAAWLWLGGSGGAMPEARATVSAVRRPSPPKPQAPQGQQEAAAIQVVPGSAPPAPEGAPAAQAPAPANATADWREVLAGAREAHREKRWAEAVLAYREAQRLSPADFDAQDRLDEAMAELEKQARLEKDLETATRMFNEADYATALHTFYRLQLDHPGMKQIEAYIRNSWFNWGVLLLQAGDVDQAAEKFTEVLELRPGDPVAGRAREVARRYHGRPRDSALESYAGSLTPRALDAR
jgi:tetratricopeptide (TPR) repeat protein